MTPEYGVPDALPIAGQIAFHERFWQEVDGGALQNDRAALAGLVSSLRPHLGDPASGNAVFEIGAGRGGLLCALRDAGYAAQGCEPAPGLVAIAREHYRLGEDVLHNIDVEQMLQSTDPDAQYTAVILWHVLEHLHNPIDILSRVSRIVQSYGVIIIQVPFLKSDYVYPEHYFFCSHDSFGFIAKEIGFSLAEVIYDEDNIYVTAVFRKSEGPVSVNFLDYDAVPDSLSQVIVLNEQSKVNYCKLTNELITTNQRLESALVGYENEIKDRDIGLGAWEKLAEDRLIAITAMEQLIEDGLTAIAAQALLIDESNANVALLQADLASVKATVASQATSNE